MWMSLDGMILFHISCQIGAGKRGRVFCHCRRNFCLLHWQTQTAVATRRHLWLWKSHLSQRHFQWHLPPP